MMNTRFKACLHCSNRWRALHTTQSTCKKNPTSTATTALTKTIEDDTNISVTLNDANSKTKKPKQRKKTSGKESKFAKKKPLLVNDISSKILRERKRCDRLQSLQEEFFIVSMINVFLAQGMVQHAEPLLNQYRREGHQFDVGVYNNIIIGWAEQNNDIKARLLYATMKSQGVSPNYRTFGALLYLFSRTDNVSEAKRIIDLMKVERFNVDHLLYYSALNSSQTQELLPLLERLGISQTVPVFSDKPSYPKIAASVFKPYDNAQSLAHTSQAVLLASMQEMVKKQLEIEERAYEVIPSIAKTAHEETPNKASSILSALRIKWESALQSAIEKELKSYKECLHTLEDNWYSLRTLPKHYPFLATLSADEWTQIVMEEIVNRTLYNSDGQPLHYLSHSVLGPAWRKFIISQKRKNGIIDKVNDFYEDYIKYTVGTSRSREMNGREFWSTMERNNIKNGSMIYDNRSWPYTVGIYLGSSLVDIVLETLKIPKMLKTTNDIDGDESKMVPAFIHTYVNQKKDRKFGTLKASPSLYRLVKKLVNKDESPSFKMAALELPMVVPPRPWTSVTEGGYLVSPGCVVRCYEDTYQHQLLLEATNTMDPVLDSLNYLSSCPWRVNKKILDIVIDLFNRGGDKDLDVPTTNLPEIPPIPSKDLEDDKQKRSMMRQRKSIKKLHKETFALRMDMLYKLSIANHYRDSLFWFPHNMDFRSRVYPIPPHISHISSDLGRSLIKFGIGYPLGEKGLDWLKIHLATLHGAKSKNSFNERLDYIDQNLSKVFDSANSPFNGEKWWQTSDEPWQALACCMELAEAIKSPDPTQFISHIPVHQDGSCNGLQHYAAMGRDQYGAEQVNLVPFDQPADLYSGVASLVNKLRKRDAEEGHELAKLLEGKVHRKVVKQTVMTVVYGVTWVGGRLQIEKQLKEAIPDQHLFNASSYLCTLVFSSLSEMFANARKIQDWLTSSARMIALSGYPVEWVTPLGMPVVQPYHKPITKSLMTRLQSVNRRNKSDFTRPPDSVKQKNAMPPNFVHSLDSTHMMLTSLHCQRVGVPFVAVHDSYWTHPCFVDQMNKICREQFVSLHNEPILEELANFFEMKYGGLEYHDGGSKWTVGKPGRRKCSFKDNLPSKGKLNLDCVQDSAYFFS